MKFDTEIVIDGTNEDITEWTTTSEVINVSPASENEILDGKENFNIISRYDLTVFYVSI